MKKFDFFKKPWGILLLLIVICGIFLGIGALGQRTSGPFRAIAQVTVVPLQSGIRKLEEWISGRTKDDILKENEALKAQAASLNAEVQKHANDADEVKRLNSLLALKDTYQNYDMTGAGILMKNSGSSWYRKFTIDKGTDDGLAVDMNVIAAGGLVGVITDIGSNYAIVTTIIDESSHVSGMLRKSLETCIVSGDMVSMSESGQIQLQYLSQNFNSNLDSTVVTSTISDKYLPGLIIGKAVDVSVGSNKVTKTGYLIPAVNFEELKEVMVITTLKQSMSDAEVEEIKAKLAETQAAAITPSAPETEAETTNAAAAEPPAAAEPAAQTESTAETTQGGAQPAAVQEDIN